MSRNHERVTLDEYSHLLSVTAFYNGGSVIEAFIEVPSTAEGERFVEYKCIYLEPRPTT